MASLHAPRGIGLLGQIQPCVKQGVTRRTLPADEGLLLEAPDGRFCVVGARSAHLVPWLDGTHTLLELLYLDMGVSGSLALDAMGRLLDDLSSEGLLEGAGGRVHERLCRALEQDSLSGGIGSLADRWSHVPVASLRREPAPGLPALPFLPALGCSAAGVVALLLVLRRLAHPDADLYVFAGSYPAGLLLMLICMAAVCLARGTLLSALLARQAGALEAGLALVYGMPWVQAGPRTGALAGRTGRKTAALSLLASEGLALAIALVGLVAGEALGAPGGEGLAGRMLALALGEGAGRGTGVPGATLAATGALLPQLAAKLVVALSVLFLIDLCPLGRGALASYASEHLGITVSDVGHRTWTFLVAKLPGKVWEGGTPTREERPYLILSTGLVAWGLSLVVGGGRIVRFALLPLVAQAVSASSPAERFILGLAAGAVGAPIVMGLVAGALALVGRAIRVLAEVRLWSMGGLFTLGVLAVAIGVSLLPLAWDVPLGPELHLVLVGLLWAGSAALAARARQRLAGSGQARAMGYLLLFCVAQLTALPVLARRLAVVTATPVPFSLGLPGGVRLDLQDVWTEPVQPIFNLGVLLLFTFFLFTFHRPAGRWLAVVALIAPFLVVERTLSAGSEVFWEPAGIRALAAAATFSFALLGFVQAALLAGTPLVMFWLLLSCGLGVQGLSRLPELIAAAGSSESPVFTGTTSTLAAALVFGALACLLQALLEPHLADRPAADEESSDEGHLLLGGVASLLDALIEGISGTFGRRWAARLAARLERWLPAAGLPLAVLGGRVQSTAAEVAPAAADLAPALVGLTQASLGQARHIVGEPFLRRLLTLAHDRLSWGQRELLDYHVFGTETWGQRAGAAVRPTQEARIALLSRIPIFALLPPAALDRLSRRVRLRAHDPLDHAVTQGESGEEFFVVMKGTADVLLEDASGAMVHLAVLSPGDCFGEVALLEKAGRTATVRARERLVCLVLGREDFQEILAASGESERIIPRIRHGSFLSRVPLFGDFSAAQIMDLAGRLTEQRVDKGATIVRQGEEGDRFYLVRDGALEVLRDERRVGQLGAGDYFGEIALVKHSPRTATVTALTDAAVLTLGKEDFFRVLAGHLSMMRSVDQFAMRRLYQLAHLGGTRPAEISRV